MRNTGYQHRPCPVNDPVYVIAEFDGRNPVVVARDLKVVEVWCRLNQSRLKLEYDNTFVWYIYKTELDATADDTVWYLPAATVVGRRVPGIDPRDHHHWQVDSDVTVISNIMALANRVAIEDTEEPTP